ncbi:ankyrin repeat and LEM domain-containing protein 2-like isoform X2 [Eriocheir sinensis]|uniref:ankyrin repeat and LEM domain-containing protein 2-like isoform X2 n=1 Tax=Eriocheir sinensis TaxID=95602 RepID=UPI0021C9EE43|nr:ankyrin repeat and LEM domain-containing protein 2-like isoform X2 [Eriocheir sinensis]
MGEMNGGGPAALPMGLPERMQRVFPEGGNALARSEAEVFYGIAVPEGEVTAAEGDIQKVFVDKVECLAALKKHRGSRFKAFRTYEEALKFSKEGAALAATQGEDVGGASAQPSLNVEKPSPFRGPKSQDLVKFRKSIEKGDLKYFSQCMEENPRYLVSSGDTPAVLQEGFRYNALHVACRTNHPEFVDKVLSTVSQAEFFQRLYPDDSPESASRRSAFLLDLYLNTPDKGFNETPLHFASKHGSPECVRILVSYPGCDTSRPNKYGQTPAEIAGSRMKNPSKDTVENIRQLLGEQYYVPLLRDDDLCLLPQVGSPWSPQLDSSPVNPSPSNDWFLTSSPLSSMSASPISPSLKVRGVAGPMSCSQAETFHRLWRNSTTSTTASSTTISTPSPARRTRGGRTASLRITDHEKGLERVGRVLAVEQRVGWREYWEFLGRFVDLGSEEGLLALEMHLRTKAMQLRKEREELDASDLAARLMKEAQEEDVMDGSPLLSPSDTQQQDGVSGLSQLSWLSHASNTSLGQLCRGLEALRLNASLSPPAEAPPTECSKFLAAQQESAKDASPEAFQDAEEAGAGGLMEQVSYILKSVDVSAGRISEMLREAALDLQANTAAGLILPRALRARLRVEVGCLGRVVGRAGAEVEAGMLEMDFVHPLLARQVVMALWHGGALADLAAAAQAVQLIVAHMDLVPLESSDEESDTARHSEAQRNPRGDTQHLACVLRCLDVALQEACASHAASPQGLQLGHCCCPWKMSAGPRNTKTRAVAPPNFSEQERATAYLRKALLLGQNDPVVRQLSFSPEEGEEEGREVLVKARLGAKEGFTVFQEAVGVSGDGGKAGSEEDLRSKSPDSFVSAASSLEGDMCTPEEGITVFVGGRPLGTASLYALLYFLCLAFLLIYPMLTN